MIIDDIKERLGRIKTYKNDLKIKINATGGNITNTTPLRLYAGNITVKEQEENAEFGRYLQTLTEPANLTSISDTYITSVAYSRFYSVYGLSTVNLPNCRYIGAYAFASCQKLISVNIPNCSVMSAYAFASCTSLSKINMEKIRYLSANAFYRCYSLESAFMPACSVVSERAFSGCTKISTITIGKAESIANWAFNECYNLLSLYVLGSSVATLGNSYALQSTMFTSSSNGVFGSIFVPTSLVTKYKQSTNWIYYSSRIVGTNISYPDVVDPVVPDEPEQPEDLSELENAISQARAENTSLTTQKTNLQSEISTIQANINASNTDFNSIESNLDIVLGG